MDRILIVSSSESGTKVLTDLLRSAGFENITASSSAADARRRSTVESYDLSIINMPLSDETGKELSFDIADKNVSG
ncbi:MAG: histidine kinase, partial [Clostridia bacterium]